ncbi:hypothetical protein FOG51_01350 [Hanseniaspora uvarum]|nr:hypothetical protein FOG48_04125 [Hanseniaspora uvarum]KAF0273779.1 hypothetical protein FOG51_01350 [Hanseniaspora uvarum]
MTFVDVNTVSRKDVDALNKPVITSSTIPDIKLIDCTVKQFLQFQCKAQYTTHTVDKETGELKTINSKIELVPNSHLDYVCFPFVRLFKHCKEVIDISGVKVFKEKRVEITSVESNDEVVIQYALNDPVSVVNIVYSQVGGKQPICCMSDVDKSGFDNTYIKKLSKDIESIVTNTEGLMNTEDSKLVNIDIKSDVQNFKYHYKLFYMTLQNVICFAIVDENQDLKQVYSFCYTVLNEMYKGITSSKNSSILYNNIPFQLINLQPMMDKLAVKTPTVNNSNSSSLEALNSELKDITSILNSNIEKLIVRGESLQNLNDLSDSLKHNSLKYKKNIKMYNLKLLMSEYAPIAFVSLIFVFLIWYIMLRK